MDFLEKDLEQIIFDNSDYKITNKGLPIYGVRKRQLRIGNYGVADLVTFVRSGSKLYVTVYELKKNEIDSKALMQAFRYCLGIKTYIEDYRKKDIEVIFYVSLVGKSISQDGDFGFSPCFLKNVHIYLYSYTIDGIRFMRTNGYYKAESGFNRSI
jgi:hypothetical protein